MAIVDIIQGTAGILAGFEDQAAKNSAVFLRADKVFAMDNAQRESQGVGRFAERRLRGRCVRAHLPSSRGRCRSRKVGAGLGKHARVSRYKTLLLTAALRLYELDDVNRTII